MNLVLDQLRGSSTLTKHYTIFHTLGLSVDLISLLLVSLSCLHFFSFPLPGSLLSLPVLTDGSTVCHLPNQGLLQLFSFGATLLLLVKTLNRLLCLLFAAGFPGLFGRNMLLYADQIVDSNQESVYYIESSLWTVLVHTMVSTTKLLFFSPLLHITHALHFYSHSLADIKGADAEIEEEPMPIEEAPHNGTNGAATLIEDRKLRVKPEVPHNWSDFFFILDLIGGNSVDRCELLIFLSRTEDLVPRIEKKRVDTTVSRLDTATNILTLAYTEGGIIEKLIESELYSDGGLAVAGWLESPNGRVEQLPAYPGMYPGYKVVPGTSYEVVSALVGREGRLLARLQNYTLHAPLELKGRQKKKYGLSVPLSALSSTEGRPLSLNFDIGR